MDQSSTKQFLKHVGTPTHRATTAGLPETQALAQREVLRYYWQILMGFAPLYPSYFLDALELFNVLPKT